MVFDGSLADHWPDILLAAFIATVGWIFRRAVSSLDRRHERAEDKFSELDKSVKDIQIRIAVIEKVCPRWDK